MSYVILGHEVDWFVSITSFCIGFILFGIFHLIFTRKRKPKMFLGFRDRLYNINNNLIEASKTIHALDETLEEIEKNAR